MTASSREVGRRAYIVMIEIDRKLDCQSMQFAARNLIGKAVSFELPQGNKQIG